MKRVVLQHMSLNKVISYHDEEEVDEAMNFHAKHFDISEAGTTSSTSTKSGILKPEKSDTHRMATVQTTMKKSTAFGLSPPSESKIMLRRWKQPVSRAVLRESESSGSSSCSSPLPSPASGYFNSTQLS